MRVRFADPRAPAQRLDAAGNIPPEALTYSVAVIRAAMDASGATNGRTLVLVPSYADVERLAPLLPAAIAHRQGTPIQKILEAYRATPGCCLSLRVLGRGGSSRLIQNLVIPRIPFLRPDLAGKAMSRSCSATR